MSSGESWALRCNAQQASGAVESGLGGVSSLELVMKPCICVNTPGKKERKRKRRFKSNDELPWRKEEGRMIPPEKWEGKEHLDKWGEKLQDQDTEDKEKRL